MATRLLRDDEPRAEKAAALVQAMAHPVRLRLLAALCEAEAPSAALAARTGLPRPVVARHLRALAARGLVAPRGAARPATWRVALPAIHGLVACMEDCTR